MVGLGVVKPFVLSLGTTGKILAPSFSPSGIYSPGEPLRAFPAPQLPQPFLLGEMLQSTILMALRWTLSSISMSLVDWEAQNWIQCSKCGLMWPHQC